MKYSYEFKLKAVKYYLQTGSYIKAKIESTRDTFTRKVNTWVKLYKEHGEKGLLHKRVVYSPTQKLNIIKKHKNGMSSTELGVIYGVDSTLIRNWVKEYDKNGLKGLYLLKVGRPKGKGLTSTEKFEIKFSNLSLIEKVRTINHLVSSKKHNTTYYLKKYHIPSSTYYSNLKKRTYKEKNSDIYLIIQNIFESSNNSYGVKRMKIAIKNEYGLIINKKKISRIMRDLNLKVKLQKGKYKSYKGKRGKICKNIINRNFKSYKPLKKITTDVTEFELPFGKVYLQPFLDMYNGEILCYQISKYTTFEPTRKLFNKLIKKYKNRLNKTIFHSDQGWQYQTTWYQNKIEELGCFQSMSRKGNCLDNSVMENFFGRLKMEIFYGKVFDYKDYNHFKKAIENYINYYNLKRIKTKLGMSPVQYRILQENQKNC